MFGALDVITSAALTEPCVDFRLSRSPSRALRRWKRRGIKGHGIFERPSRKFLLVAGGKIVCHPVMYGELMRKIAEAEERNG